MTVIEETPPLLRQRYRAVFRSMIYVAILSYGGYLVLFVALGVPYMPWVNVLATALSALAGWILARGHTRTALGVMGIVVLGHCVPSTAVLGWDANFHLFAFLFLVFILLDPDFGLPTKMAISVLVTAGYLFLGTMPRPLVPLPPHVVATFKVLNIVVFSGTMSYLALLYAASIWSATDRLHGLVTAERNARDNFQAIFANAPVSLALSRLSDNILLDANQSAASLFETSLDEARGRPAPDFWANPEDRARLLELVAREGRASGFQAALHTKLGRSFFAEVTASVVQIDGSPALLTGIADITLRQRAEEALRRRETMVRTFLDAAPSPMIVSRIEDGQVLFINSPAAELFKLPLDQAIGRRAPDFYVRSEDRRAVVEGLSKNGRIDGLSVQLRTLDGQNFWGLLSARLFDLDGEPAMMVGFADVSAQKVVEEQLRTEATTDALTGLPNRRGFVELAESELVRSARHGYPISVGMLDLDHFKVVNDTFGHGFGDSVLNGLADLLRKHLRRNDVVGRIGGEEFALLLPHTESAPAMATLERVREAVQAMALRGPERDRHQRVTVSIGLVRLRQGETLVQVLQRADGAMYRAKAAGRNRLVVEA
jgi:diguanylate cyclase (GGDEF)-like protein/PAS domain S-box-containing protein